MPMVKTYSMDLVERVEAGLDTAERPAKTHFRKRELLEKWATKIKEMKKRGFDYREIAQTVSDLSDGEIRFFAKEIEEICSGGKRSEKEKQPTRRRRGHKSESDETAQAMGELTQPSDEAFDAEEEN